LIEAYYQSYPQLVTSAVKIDFARDNGYVQTVLGRRSTLKTSTHKMLLFVGAERNAVNAPIQGNIIKIAMITFITNSKLKIEK
jgi:DNA polymerase-1